MSRMYFLASDKPLPLTDCQTGRRYENAGVTLTVFGGFALRSGEPFAGAVAELRLPDAKPYWYALEVDNCEEDARNLTAYLRKWLTAGESVELWSVWLGGDCGPLTAYRGPLTEFDKDTLAQLFECDNQIGGVIRLSVTA